MLFPPAALLDQLPSPSTNRIALRVTPSAERALRKGHPWLYENAIIQQNKVAKPGDLAVIFDRSRRFLAIGLYDPSSSIRVRILQHHKPALINKDFFKARLIAAAKIRQDLPQKTNGFRLVHGGNDGFPGLVIDRYADTLVFKLYTVAWLPYLRIIIKELGIISPSQRVILRLSRRLKKQPEFLYTLNDGDILFGKPITTPLLFQENGVLFEVDPLHGHKTGFYLDQRDNRVRVSKLAMGKSILNVFSYTGGFSIYAAKGGATHVTSLDISRPALETAIRNFKHNEFESPVRKCDHKTVLGDAFQNLSKFHHHQRLFDMIIIDPPSFAKDQSQIPRALRAYKRLTILGLNLLRKDGILVQASCSSRVKSHEFFSSIYSTAGEMERPLQEIERTGHPLDHPIGFKEGAYLKCLFAIAK